MTKQPAMKIRIDLAHKVDPGDMESILNHAKGLEELKAKAVELGFVFTADVNAKLGSYTFEDDADDPVKTSPE